MAEFDPSLRRITMCFQRTNYKNWHGEQCLKILPFHWVEYDSSPDRMLEPINSDSRYHDEEEANPVRQETDGMLIAGFEFFDSAVINDVHQFSDV